MIPALIAHTKFHQTDWPATKVLAALLLFDRSCHGYSPCRVLSQEHSKNWRREVWFFFSSFFHRQTHPVKASHLRPFYEGRFQDDFISQRLSDLQPFSLNFMDFDQKKKKTPITASPLHEIQTKNFNCIYSNFIQTRLISTFCLHWHHLQTHFPMRGCLFLSPLFMRSTMEWNLTQASYINIRSHFPSEEWER